MAHYGTLFKPSPDSIRRLTPAEHRTNLQAKLNRKLQWFIDHSDWMQALGLVQRSGSRTRFGGRNQLIIKNVVTPDHYIKLLGMSTSIHSATPPAHLLEHVRHSCATDEIPNSPQLYQALVAAFCRGGWTASAIETAVEGHARWRFDPKLRQQMAVSILERCAAHQHGEAAWATALQCVQHVLIPTSSAAAASSSSTSSSVAASVYSLQDRKRIVELLDICAERSGLWLSSSNENNNDIAADNDEKKWLACHHAALEGNWQRAIQLFSLETTTSTAGGNNNKKRDAARLICNELGSLGNWETCLKFANAFMFSQRGSNSCGDDDPVLCNLVFASFPSPFVETSSSSNNIAASSEAAVRLFESWMCDLDDFTPPALTCALMCGFYARCGGNNTSDNNNSWRENCKALLTSFTIDKNPNSRLDQAAYEAIQLAMSPLGLNLSEEERSQLKFPSPGYDDRIAAISELARYRAEHWNNNKLQAEEQRNPLSRPNRAAYFPVKEEIQRPEVMQRFDDARRKAIEVAQQMGERSFTETDETTAQHHHVSSAFHTPRPAPVGKNDKASGYSYYRMGGDPIYPSGSKIASPLSSRPKRMPTLKKTERSWAGSTPRATMRRVAKGYKTGTPI